MHGCTGATKHTLKEFIMKSALLTISLIGCSYSSSPAQMSYSYPTPAFENLSDVRVEKDFAYRYVRDQTTGLCFIRMSSGASGHTGAGLTNIPCERIPGVTTTYTCP